MKKVKKIIAVVLSLCMIFLCTACAGQSEPAIEDETKNDLTEFKGSKETSNIINENDSDEEDKHLEQPIDLYDGLPAPIELKLVNSNGKRSIGNDDSYSMEFSMYLIEDYYGLQYLVLTCSATSNYSDRKVTGPDYFPEMISKANVEMTFDLERKVKDAYDEIIYIGYMGTLYPGETVRESYIYDFYGEKSNITVVLKPSLIGTIVSGDNNYFHGMYTGNYLYSDSDWEKYIFLEFSF